MKKILLSVIITYYKKKNYIKKTLKSLENQSFKNYQVILVYDDPDKTDLNYIKKLLFRFKNRTIIINKKNLGVAKSRNIASRYVKGKYTAYLDSDDIWKKNKIKNQLSAMLKKNMDLSYTSFLIINEHDTTIGKRIISKKTSYQKLIKRCEIGLSTVIVKSTIIKKFKFPEIKTQEDFGLWLKLLRNNYKFLAINTIYSSWRKDSGSLSSNKIQKIIDAFKLFYKYENKNLIFSIYSVVILSINKLIN
jgi:teichuronic acid biosynthesis glycosyltransferase TuaG